MIVVSCLADCRFHQLIFNFRVIKQIIDRLSKSGINILIHRTAGPARIHIRAFTGTHGNDQFFLIGVILSRNGCYGIAGICLLVKFVHSSFDNIFIGTFCTDIPIHDLLISA